MNISSSRGACALGWFVAVLAGALVAQATAQNISWSIPPDGGTPRHLNRIEQLQPLEFRIRASFEEGGQSVLRHAVSRLDLVCRNGDARAATVTVHLDLSDDGKRTDYDNKPEAGMKLRDFIFIQSPGQAWRQVDGVTTGWVATLSFEAKPGETKVGLSPWYTPRAWLRFTQLFASLHAAGHRWKDETTPLRYNWEGRRPLSEVNVHQYAMKKHGTHVWGWEMPWWNHLVPDARQYGARFAQAFLTTLDEIHAGKVPIATEQRTIDVARWEIHEFSLTGRSQFTNAFRDTALVGEFISPSGHTNVVDGFYDGDNTWRLRFAPEEEGEWRYLLRGEGVELVQRGKLRCTPARARGFIRVHPANPYAFAFANGTAFFPMGDTCYGLFDDSPITPALREEYLRIRRDRRFNFVRMTVGHSEARAGTNSAFWAWGGTPEKPDLDRFNPAFFHLFDRLMQQLRESGMNVELILVNFYRRPFTDTRQWTPARERQWLRYLLARYCAFDNVFLWTLANEYETHPDGKYRLDFPSDVDWAKTTARFIKTNDPYRHLVTVHPVISASRRGDTPRAPIDEPWRIGEFFGNEDALDVLSHQTGQGGAGTIWNDQLQCWTGDATTLVASIRADRRFNKPVLNTENGYEYLRGYPTGKKQVHHTDKVRRSAWRIVCAGGYFAAGFHGTIGHSDVWNRIDKPNHYSFALRDEGAPGYLAVLYDFFAVLPFWRMQPDDVAGDAIALAEPGKTYVVYLPHGGAASLNLSGADPLVRRWFNPRTAEFGPSTPLPTTNGRHEFTAPNGDDWVLLLSPSG